MAEAAKVVTKTASEFVRMWAARVAQGADRLLVKEINGRLYRVDAFGQSVPIVKGRRKKLCYVYMFCQPTRLQARKATPRAAMSQPTATVCVTVKLTWII